MPANPTSTMPHWEFLLDLSMSYPGKPPSRVRLGPAFYADLQREHKTATGVEADHVNLPSSRCALVLDPALAAYGFQFEEPSDGR